MYVRGSLDICWQTEGAHARSELVPCEDMGQNTLGESGFLGMA